MINNYNTANTQKPSLKPNRGRSWKRLRRIEIAVRLESAFLKDDEIARHLGITLQALYHIKATPEFLAKRITLQTGVLSVYDQGTLTTQEAQKEEIEDLSVLALGAVKTILMDKTHPHHAKVAVDMLDRNRATAKISRTEHSLAPKVDTSAENLKARELLEMLGGAVPELEVSAESLVLVEAVPFVPEEDDEEDGVVN